MIDWSPTRPRGIVIPGVRRCVLRIENPTWPGGWTAAATTHPDDRDGLDTDVAFRIASVTKLVTATALLALVDQGRCRLDDQTGQYLPGSVLDRFRDRQGRPYAAGLTLRQLLDHTSGLPNYFTDPAILDAVRDGGGRRRFTPLDLINLAAAAPPPSSPPGTARSYTDTGFVLAGLIIESLTGGPLDAGYRDLVLDPAGMTDTWLESSDEPPRRDVISPHEFEGLRHQRDGPNGRLGRRRAGQHRLRPRRPPARADPGRTGERRRMDGDDPLAGRAGRLLRRYGLGLGRYQFPTATFVGHHGVWGAFAFWSPELDAIVTGTVNTAPVDRRPLLDAIIKALAHS